MTVKYTFSMTGDTNAIVTGTAEQINDYLDENGIEYFSEREDDMAPLTVEAMLEVGSNDGPFYRMSNLDDGEEFMLVAAADVIQL